MGKRVPQIDPLGETPTDQVQQQTLEQIDHTIDSELTTLRAQVIDLRTKLEAIETERELAVARAEAAETELAKREPGDFDPNVPHMIKQDYAFAMTAGRGTMFLTAGQIVKDPAHLKLLHDMGVPMARV